MELLLFKIRQSLEDLLIFRLGPTTPNCPLICSQECDDDELLCPGGTDDNGCYENDFCHPKGTGNEGEVCQQIR